MRATEAQKITNKRWRDSPRGKKYAEKYRYSKRRDKARKKWRDSSKGKKSRYRLHEKWRGLLKFKAIKKLGNKCNHCGYKERLDILQIDHVNGGGSIERKKIGVAAIRRKIMNGEIEEYQLLCPNCNWIKRTDNKEHRGYLDHINDPNDLQTPMGF